ncbi:MAG: guanitoxin biosynthesis heme-dependent pre-guanitoxin N-hydroxylase GntA [Ginsengibacter sp.]
MEPGYESEKIQQEYFKYIDNKDFACIAAKAALAKQQLQCLVVDSMACPKDDTDILKFLYKFIDCYQNSKELYHSAAVIFKEPLFNSEEMFEKLMWQRLQAISDMDSIEYNYDSRVDHDPASPNFSFSVKKESLFIIGLHPASSRLLRRFKYPALVFNPHMQFEELKDKGKYKKMKDTVRKRDIAFSGSVNPMLTDFGEASEVYQYSGRQYNTAWQCPLKINHAANENNTTP